MTGRHDLDATLPHFPFSHLAAGPCGAGSSIAAPAADLVGRLTGRTGDTARPALPRRL